MWLFFIHYMDKWYLRRLILIVFFRCFLFLLMDESMRSSRWKREGRHHSHFRIRYLLAAYYFFVVKGKFRRLVCSVAFIFLLDLNSDSLQQSSLRFFFCLYPPWIDYCYCSFSTAWTSGVFFSTGWCSQYISQLSALLSLSAFSVPFDGSKHD